MQMMQRIRRKPIPLHHRTKWLSLPKKEKLFRCRVYRHTTRNCMSGWINCKNPLMRLQKRSYLPQKGQNQAQKMQEGKIIPHSFQRFPGSL